MNRRSFSILLVILFVAGLGLRLYDLDDLPLDFHPARQIHSAILARGFAASLSLPMTDFERARATSLGSSEAWIEPPILEGITALTWRLSGNMNLWIPRLFSILFWMAGGIGLVLLMLEISGQAAVIGALMFYLFLPYGVVASRSFQPDPLMTALIIFSAWSMLAWSRKTTLRNAMLAGLLGGLAILVKQVALFFVGGALAGLFIAQWVEVRWLEKRYLLQTALVVILALFPAILYNIYGLWVEDFLRDQYSMRFFPELLRDIGFYIRWMQKVDSSVGVWAAAAALLGFSLLREKRAGGLFLGLGFGYLVYGLAFAHHISTHDYYQLPLIPIAAVGVGLMVGRLVEELGSARALPRLALAGGVLLWCAYGSYQAYATVKKVDYRGEAGLWRSLSERMGYQGQRVIGLFDDYGVRLMYWGLSMPAVWLSTGEQQFRLMGGTPPPEVQQDIFTRLEGRLFFVITDFEELERQADLKQVLETTFPVFTQGPGYLIYDLRTEK